MYLLFDLNIEFKYRNKFEKIIDQSNDLLQKNNTYNALQTSFPCNSKLKILLFFIYN